MNTRFVHAPGKLQEECLQPDDCPGGTGCEKDRVEDLTRRELETLSLLVQGRLRKEIAVEMKIQRGTVDEFIKRIYGKLRVHSKTEAAVKYLRHLARVGLF